VPTSASWSALRMSLEVGAGALLLLLPIGIALGWLLARHRFRGRTLLEAVVLLPLVLPPVVTGYALLVLFGRRGWIGEPLFEWFGLRVAFTTFGMILAGAAVGLPLLVRAVQLAVENVDPDLESAARNLGAGPWETFRRITFPLARSGILAGALLAFARAVGEFGATVMIAPNTPGTRTLALEIYREASTPGGEGAVARLAILSVLLSFLALLGTERLAPRRRRVRP